MRKRFLMWSPPVSQFPIGETSATMIERSRSAQELAFFADLWWLVDLARGTGPKALPLPLTSRAGGGDGDLDPFSALSYSSSLPDTSTSLPLPSSSDCVCRMNAVVSRREGPACAAPLAMYRRAR